MDFTSIVTIIDDFLWGAIIPGFPVPGILVLLLVPIGVYLSIILKGIQVTKLIPALTLAFIKRKEGKDVKGDVSHFQALTTALSATVGTGNIAGVATAVSIGGPGAIFWMWVTGAIGMATKYTESYLGCKYRETDVNGEQVGGPQIYLKHAIKGKPGVILAKLFAFFTIIAATFGIGNMIQVNSITKALNTAFLFDELIVGWVVMILVGLIVIGGIKRIGTITSFVVPFMIILYLGIGLFIIGSNIEQIPNAFKVIINGAFGVTPAVGGFAGSTMALAIQKGMSRGVFSNESGLGTGGIAASSAKTSSPVIQGLVSMTQTFIDTIIIVTFTGLIIVMTNAWSMVDSTGKAYEGSDMTARGFDDSILGNIGDQTVAICLTFFAFTTIIGWSYYGERCAVSLFSIKAKDPFKIIFTSSCILGAIVNLDLVWIIGDVSNGLMALPNLIGLLLLAPIVAKETNLYLKEHPKILE